MSDHTYQVQVWTRNSGSGFAFGTLVADLTNAMNVAYADYALDVPEAFFTVNQEDPQLATIVAYEGNAHVLIIRDGTIVWSGWLGEHDATDTDVVFYCYGLLAGLYWIATDWDVEYTNAQIDSIVSDAWTRAKTDLTDTELNFVTTGTIEAPVTTSGGATAVVLPTYSLFYKRILFLMREMAILGIGNTTNSVLFEITFGKTPTFNFWKNVGQDRSILWEYGSSLVRTFHDSSIPIMRRNDLLGVGASASGNVLQQENSDATSISSIGRKQDSVYFAWVRDQTEFDRAMQARLALSMRNVNPLTIGFHANAIDPPYANGGAWRITDQVRIKIDRGATQINELRQIAGYQVLYVKGSENINVLTQQRSGS